jgi:hypothetical protein
MMARRTVYPEGIEPQSLGVSPIETASVALMRLLFFFTTEMRYDPAR